MDILFAIGIFIVSFVSLSLSGGDLWMISLNGIIGSAFYLAFKIGRL